MYDTSVSDAMWDLVGHIAPFPQVEHHKPPFNLLGDWDWRSISG